MSILRVDQIFAKFNGTTVSQCEYNMQAVVYELTKKTSELCKIFPMHEDMDASHTEIDKTQKKRNKTLHYQFSNFDIFTSKSIQNR